MPPSDVQEALRDAARLAEFVEWLQGGGYEVINVVQAVSPLSSIGPRVSAVQVLDCRWGQGCGCLLYNAASERWSLFGPCFASWTGYECGTGYACGPCPQDSCEGRR